MRTADTIEEQKSVDPPKARKKHKMHPNSLKNLVAPWPKGYTPNPSGLPGYDVAAVLCRKIIEQNEKEIYKGMASTIIGGNAYALSVVADRGYGKLKEKHEHTGEVSIIERLAAGRKRLNPAPGEKS